MMDSDDQTPPTGTRIRAVDVGTDTPTRLRDRNAEELTAPLRERAARSRDRANRRVDAAEVLERRDARRADLVGTQERRAKRTAGLRRLVGAGLLIAACGVGYLASTSTDRATADQAQAQVVIADYTSRVDALTVAENALSSGDDSGGPGSSEDAAVAGSLEQLAEVRAKGDEVATLQSEFLDLLLAKPDTTDNGAPSQGFLDTVEHRRKLVPYFAEDTFIVDEALVYTLTSTFDLAQNQVDPRLQWYERGTGGGKYTWKAEAVNAGQFGVVEVVWLCRDDATGDVLAWARATWAVDEDVFTDLTVGSILGTMGSG